MSGPVPIPVLRQRPGELSPDGLDAIRAMRARAYADMSRPVDEHTARARREQAHRLWVRAIAPPRDAMMHLTLDGQRFTAVAQTFTRVIRSAHGELRVLALAGVASDPDHRGRGWGRAVVLDALRRIHEGVAPLCLFQTGQARGFYEKLGCVLVTNRFIDTTADVPQANPWWDAHVMRYPAQANWPTDEIDLQGPGY